MKGKGGETQYARRSNEKFMIAERKREWRCDGAKREWHTEVVDLYLHVPWKF